MEQVSQASGCHGVASGRLDVSGASGARIVVYLELQPLQTVSWRLTRHAELRIVDESVWLTRHQDPYDYWMKPGDVVRLARGERVWLSSESDRAVEVSLTSYRVAGRSRLSCLSRWLAKIWPRLADQRANAF